MNHPSDVLGLTPDADLAAIRAKYLELVRQHPPDRDPQRFAEIQAAYEELRDPVKYLRQLIFLETDVETLDELAAQVRARSRKTRIPVDRLLAMGDG